MKYLLNTIHEYIDFHFVLALIAIFGTAASLYLQFNEANNEFDILNASMYSVVRSGGIDLKEDEYLSRELEDIERSLDVLNLN